MRRRNDNETSDGPNAGDAIYSRRSRDCHPLSALQHFREIEGARFSGWRAARDKLTGARDPFTSLRGRDGWTVR